MILVLMGVSGSGKTTIGTEVARLGRGVFADGDDYHPAANKQKMAAKQALTDADREPWLTTLNGLLQSWYTAGTSGVLACSALKAKYREMLGAGMPAGSVHFVLLEGSKEMIAARLAARNHEFMTPALLESQIQTLEPPDEDDPDAFRIVNDRPPESVAEEILRHFGLLEAAQAE